MAALLLAACSSSSPYANAAPVTRTGPSVLTVRNDNWQDMRIYLVTDSGSRPMRIGVVPSLTTSRIKVPVPLTGSTRILLRPLGTRAEYLTNPVYVAGGGALSLTVHNALNLSMLSVW